MAIWALIAKSGIEAFVSPACILPEAALAWIELVRPEVPRA